MNLIKAAKSGKPFKREYSDTWLFFSGGTLIELGINEEVTPSITYIDSEEDILANDYVIREVPEWLKGNFTKRYPYGVWCEVWDDPKVKRYGIVTGYKENLAYPFVTTTGTYRYARPLTKEEAEKISPAIINKGGLKNESSKGCFEDIPKRNN